MRKSSLLAALGGLVSLVVLASPAQAAPPTAVWEPFEEGDTITLPTDEDREAGFTDFCGFEAVELTFTNEGELFTQIRGNSAFPYFAARGVETNVFTNPDTGLTFTVVREYFDKDLHVVDNGDDTLTITYNSRIRQEVYGPDGELLFIDRGLIRGNVLIDTLGTPEPEDDEFIEELGEPRLSGNFDTAERNFCEDFIEFTS